MVKRMERLVAILTQIERERERIRRLKAKKLSEGLDEDGGRNISDDRYLYWRRETPKLEREIVLAEFSHL